MSSQIPWLVVNGFGAHIKSNPKKLIILQKSEIREYPIEDLGHLLVVGGHTLHTSTVAHLLKKGVFVSFFEADGSPLGVLRPYGSDSETGMRNLQQNTPRHRYAIAFAQGALKSRLVLLEKIEESRDKPLLYEGESEFIHKAIGELEYLIKLDEIRRLHHLTSDMYYEIMSRTVPPELGYKRRTVRPQKDAVNSMLSLGYAMLYGNCCVSVLGAHLDPDIGSLHSGPGGLVQDLIDPFKARMIDGPAFLIAAQSVHQDDYELSATRCLLSDDYVKNLIALFEKSLLINQINEQVILMSESLKGHEPFRVLY
jgi:CRISPR-associated endonuclease Cas1